MKTTIAIGILGLALLSSGAAAQTAGEQAQILRGFEQSVNDYARHHCLSAAPEVVHAATHAPKIFTLPVAMVFRQLIARAIPVPAGAVISASGSPHRAMALEPLPPTDVYDVPAVLREALPALPDSLEYRLIDNDLVIRDANADVVIAVLRDALGAITTR